MGALMGAVFKGAGLVTKGLAWANGTTAAVGMMAWVCWMPVCCWGAPIRDIGPGAGWAGCGWDDIGSEGCGWAGIVGTGAPGLPKSDPPLAGIPGGTDRIPGGGTVPSSSTCPFWFGITGGNSP